MINKWIYMEVIDAMPNVDLVQCNTRNFHIFLSNIADESLQEIIKALLDSIEGDVEDYMFARSEILGCLAALENASGGKAKWRILRIIGIPGWLKYINFVRYKDGYIAYDRNYNPLKRKDLDADNAYADNL